MMSATDTFGALVERWKVDPGATCRGWFLWNQRLKNFRSIRRGLGAVVREIDAGRRRGRPDRPPTRYRPGSP